MLRNVSTALVAILCAASLPVHADEVDDAIKVFLDEHGFERHDAQVLDGKLLQLFDQTGAMRPDGAASALEKALLLVEAMEPSLPRVRYMVRYGQMIQEETPVAFVSVERYNLGPAIRQMVAEDYGEENTAEPEEFGVGPHVAWRIVTMPLMGQTAALLEAARSEIGEAGAASADCAGRGCLSVDSPLDVVREWRETPIEVNVATAYPRTDASGMPTPAFVAAELSIAAGLAQSDGGEPFWNGPEHPEAARGSAPFLFVTIDSNLGQEVNVDAALGQTLLNDDAIAELWVRRAQFPDGEDSPVYRFESETERKR